MEEISWGQHQLGFESGDYFKAHNHQQETNLHNFMPAEIFSSIIYTSVYVIFVFLPLLTRLLAPFVSALKPLETWLPSLHITLVVLFSALFQVYFFHENVGAMLDMVTMMVGLFCFALLITVQKNGPHRS